MNEGLNKHLKIIILTTHFVICRSCTKIASGPSQYSGGGTRTVNMFTKLMSQGSNFVMEGVKNLVVKKHVSTNSR